MHLIVPFAAPLCDEGRPAAAGHAADAALQGLALPRLEAWLQGGVLAGRDDGDDGSLSTPDERALARAFGWPLADGALPWAARAARADGIDVGERAWGLLTPVHWRVGADAVHLADPQALALDAADSRALFDAVRDLFVSEGIELVWGAPLRWYASHPSLAALPCASIDRVIGRNIDRWLPAQREARLLRRLQNEVQMRLHEHPLNAAREAAGQVAVNSFWLSGCGVGRAEAAHDAVVDDALRAPALAQDWTAWRAAWAALDARPALRDASRLTLCGERGAFTLEAVQRNAWQRLRHRLGGPRRELATMLRSI